MSILDRFLGSDDADADDGGDDGDDDLLFDEGGDDFDDLGGGDEFGDELDFGGGDDGGGSSRELEGRVDELENEVSSLSSTVGTIKSENEEISNTVDDIEENVRKLLDIYEMVTRGVNPFVDDVQAGGDFDDGGGLGLFDTDDGGGEEDDLDEELAGAEAEDFFDDDFLDDEGDGGFDDGDALEAETNSGTDMADDTDDSGKSFEELKEEYDSGDADWAEEASSESETTDDGDDFGGDEEFGDDLGDEGFDDSMGGFDDGDAFGGDDIDEGFAEDDPPTTDEPIANGHAAESDGGPGGDSSPTEPPETSEARSEPNSQAPGDLQFAENTLMSGADPRTKPYLDALPAGFAVDMLVLEWLEYLVEESDVTDTARAIEYYRTIQWISDDVADGLRNFLNGFGTVDAENPEGVHPTPQSLDLDDHINSLQYVSRLTSGTSDALLFERSLRGGGNERTLRLGGPDGI